MDMSNEFLRSYKIPIIINSSIPGETENHKQLVSPVSNDKTDGSTADAFPSSTTLIQESQLQVPLLAESETKQQNQHRSMTLGKQLADSSSIKRPIKRKLSDTSSRGDIISSLGRDESYPDLLNALFKPLFCELCNAHLNSSKTAAIHYKSKTHDKNINIWLTRNYKDKGLESPIVKRFYSGDTGPIGPNAYHCESCDLNLTSKLHAEQHYSGRKHKLVLSNISKPSGSGYYNADGRWVRTGTRAANDGRFGIGEQFKSKIANPIFDRCDGNELGSKTQPETVAQVEIQNITISESLTCKLCEINVTSPSQMSLHLVGSKHQKKVKASGDQVPTSAAIKANDTVLNSLNSAGAAINDISMYRTPSGSYYCKTCNLSILHQSALVQHLLGKKHIKKSVDANTVVDN